MIARLSLPSAQAHSSDASLSALPSLPRDAEGPVFRAPWEAQAFALAVQLQERGLFTWEEWADALGAEIGAAQKAGDPDLGNTYYLHWLAALERLVVAKGAASESGLNHMRDAWDRAAKATPHGQPIVLR
jgi:nitrile hydratase accessory protein